MVAMKRILDVVISAVGLLASAPLQGVIAAAVGLTMGRPILFRQPRPGKDGEVFELVKFRTMLHEDPARGRIDDATRMTDLGRFLRSTSLDELPTLWNVLVGDMSLVGPRPLLVRYLDRYTPEQRRRHAVRPGLTGLAQVSGRNAITWDERLRLDVEYVETHTLRGDLAILWRTATKVVRRDGISAPGEATMSEFTGTSLPPGVGTSS